MTTTGAGSTETTKYRYGQALEPASSKVELSRSEALSKIQGIERVVKTNPNAASVPAHWWNLVEIASHLKLSDYSFSEDEKKELAHVRENLTSATYAVEGPEREFLTALATLPKSLDINRVAFLLLTIERQKHAQKLWNAVLAAPRIHELRMAVSQYIREFEITPPSQDEKNDIYKLVYDSSISRIEQNKLHISGLNEILRALDDVSINGYGNGRLQATTLESIIKGKIPKNHPLEAKIRSLATAEFVR